jgi:propanol-preferring alcohol dehydrogenase
MFAEYVVVDSHTAASIPASISFVTAAPLACAGCTVWKGIIDAALQPGDWLAIIGSGGGVGHLGIKFAKAMGLKVIGVDARDTGLELSHQAGADLVVDARKPQNELLEAIHSATELGAHATLNVSDAEPAATTACLVTRKHGTVIQIAQVRMPDVALTGYLVNNNPS